MSTIIDALKKTQSAIDKKPYADHSIYGDIEIPHRGTQNTQSHASLLGQKRKLNVSASQFKNFFSFLNYRYIIGLTICLFLFAGIWLGYRYDDQITSGMTKLISNITSEIKTRPHEKPPIAVIITPPPKIKPTLNGTVRAGVKRDAMINNHLYRVGDMVNGYRILEIHYDQVTLLDSDTKKTIVLTTNL
jgi:hypothetical protein